MESWYSIIHVFLNMHTVYFKTNGVKPNYGWTLNNCHDVLPTVNKKTEKNFPSLLKKKKN